MLGLFEEKLDDFIENRGLRQRTEVRILLLFIPFLTLYYTIISFNEPEEVSFL